MELNGGGRWGPWRTAIAFGVVAIVLAFAYWLQYILLLSFLAVLLALLFDVIARVGIRYLKMPRGMAVVVAAVLFVLLLGGIVALLAVPVIEQGTAFLQSLPRKITNLSHQMEKFRNEFPWLRHILPSTAPPVTPPAEGPRPVEFAKTAFFTASAALEWSVRLLAMFFLGIFLAWDPERWLRGVAGLWPHGSTDERIDLLRKMGSALRSYLLTMSIYVVAMGSLWTLGLWIIGIEYPLLFGVIGGLAEIVPYLGPLLGLIPPLLFALTMEPIKVIYVLAVYVLLHIFEGYVMVPYLLHRQEHLPPPLVLFSILVFGSVFGPLGIILAVPLGIVGYVWAIERGYRHA